MRRLLYIVDILLSLSLLSQDFYEEARVHFNEGDLDSARLFINRNLSRKPTADDYYLSGLIHEAANADLRALADYEAVIRKDPDNLEAYFQKGLIYYNSASPEQAIADFTYVINNHKSSGTNAIYFGNDPLGAKGTFLTTLQSMMGRVFQYRGIAYQKIGDYDKSLRDFNKSLVYDSSSEAFINRAMLYSKLDQNEQAISDLRQAISFDERSYLAWYNLAVLDPEAELPTDLIEDEEFAPMLTLMGANAYEGNRFSKSAEYYSKAIEANPGNAEALIGRGKSLLKIAAYSQARKDFVLALQEDANRIESLYLIGNSFFYEEDFKKAIGFYNQYLSIDQSYANVWYNVAMAYLSEEDEAKACSCLQKAVALGMNSAKTLFTEKCDSQ